MEVHVVLLRDDRYPLEAREREAFTEFSRKVASWPNIFSYCLEGGLSRSTHLQPTMVSPPVKSFQVEAGVSLAGAGEISPLLLGLKMDAYASEYCAHVKVEIQGVNIHPGKGRKHVSELAVAVSDRECTNTGLLQSLTEG